MPTATQAVKSYETDTLIGAELDKMMRLKAQIDDLQQQLDNCKAGMLAHAKRHGFRSMQIKGFSVTVRERHNWTYSNDLRLLMNQVTLSQKAEQVNGIAKDAPTEHLVLTFKAKDLIPELI